MISLNVHTLLIQEALGFPPHPSHSLITLLDTWLNGGGNVPPTWKNLLSLIRQLHLDDLAQQVETYLSGVTAEQHPEKVGEREISRVMTKEGA